MSKRFNAGYDFANAAGLKTGQNLVDLVEQAGFAVGTTALDQSTLEDNGAGAARIKALGVGTSYLKDGAVTEAKINDSAVTEAKIDDSAVTENKLADGAVTTDKIADDAVTTDKIPDSNVTKAKLENVASMSVLGNAGEVAAAPVDVGISNDTTLAGDSEIKLVTEHAAKTYTDTRLLEASRIRQTVALIDGSKKYTSNATTIPADNTIPQSSEGMKLMELKITPKKIGSVLIVDVIAYFSCNGSSMVASLFKNAGADAVAVGMGYYSGNHMSCFVIKHIEEVTSLDEITFMVRGGGDGTYVNFNCHAHDISRYGGKIASSITITEVG